ncbi:MAG: MBL fold metallo-hydrolase [Clostridia bacterium]|nr:MBL fold metallo-hydrolase [Clostridia bacterium]
MVRVCTLYSGSSANCTYIENDGRAILIDAGAGVKKTEQALKSIGSDYDKIEAIFITHEHSDHIAGLKTILKYHSRIPVIGNERTLLAIKNSYPEMNCENFHPMATGAKANNGVIQVTSFQTLHDSAECVGYIVNTGNKKIGVMTDVGEETSQTAEIISSCDAVVLESNHDADKLWNGNYPYMLKKRIGGKYGHFSNEQCGDLLERTAKSTIKHVILAHLSKENNTPEMAFDTVSKHLENLGAVVGGDIDLSVAPRNEVSKIITFN